MKVGELHWPRGMTVYVDMDGVLADFEAGYHRLFGRRPGSESRDDPNIAKLVGTDFFGTLPKYDSADALIQLVLDHAGRYSICTAPLRNDHKNSGHWKREWLAQHISPAPRQIKVNGQKEVYAVGADGVPNVLIDDKPKNIQRWRAAGGIAVEYYAPRDGLDVVAQGLRQSAQWRPDAVKESATGDLEKDLKDPLGYDAIDHMMQTISRRHGITANRLHDLFVAKHGCTPDHWIKQGVTEGRSSGYKEIEFICANPKFPNATDPKLQKQMYAGLKQIPGVIPLFQDQSDYSEGQYSLTAIYKDRDVRGQILKLAKQLGVKVDLEQPVTDDYVDRAIRGEHEGQQGMAEGLEEAVGGNYLYHATMPAGIMRILRDGLIKASWRPQEATKAKTKYPTVSTTRSKQYAESDNFVNFLNLTKDGNAAIMVFDRNAVANHYKMFSTSQGTQNVGDEYEEVIVVPKGAMPIRGTLKGFYFNPKRAAEIEEYKDFPWFKELLKSPYYLGPRQGVAEGGAETSWSNDTDTITLQDILELTKHIKQINLPINDNLKSKLLHWEGNPEEIERVNQVTVSNQFPILIMVDEQGQIAWILDGNHRLHKAIQSQAKTIPAKLIRPSNLDDKAKKIFNIKEQGVAEGKSNDTAISLSRLGKFHPGADTLAEFVPERATAQYALHPDKWESTFYSLTNKDSDKLKYYGPKKISIPPGTLVGDMAIANKFYRAKTPEEKQQYAEAYKASLQPYPVDVSEYRMPELLIPRQGVAESLEVDVPNERWLQKKIDYAKRKGRTSYGVPYMGTTTAYTSQNTRVPVDILRQLLGMRREQQNVRQDNLKALVKIMKDTGRLPMHQGQYPPSINVAWNGEAWVNDGNHRIMAAAALGWKDLPVQIRYFDGGERVKSGVMYPGRIGLGDIKENFADGRGPGRPGDSRRHGIKKGVTLAQLDRIVHSKTASPRKKQLAHWAANMRRGKAKKK